METALVILNYNGAELLKKYLPTIIKHCTSEVEIIVADNNSNDNSLMVMANDFPDVRVIKLEENYGFAQGYNKALEQVDAEYYILCNSDIELKSDAVSPLIELMKTDKKISAAMPNLKSLKEPQKFEYAGAAGGFIDKFGYPFCRGRILENLEIDNNQYQNNIEIFWATGAFMAVRADVYKKLGGLDALFFAHMEEIDLCWRMKNAGYKIVSCGKSEAYHLGGATLNKTNPKKLFFNYRNGLKMMFKNLSGKQLLPILFVRMCLDGISAMIYLLKLQFKNFWAVLKAHFAFYFSLKTLIKQRKECKKNVVNYYHKECYPKSIVFDCLIKKKTKFEDLDFKIKEYL